MSDIPTGKNIQHRTELLTRFVYYGIRCRPERGVYCGLIEKPCPETTFLCAFTQQCYLSAAIGGINVIRCFLDVYYNIVDKLVNIWM